LYTIQHVTILYRPIKITAAQAKKLKTEPRDKNEVAAESALEELIAKQTKQMFKVRDTIEPLVNKADLQNILFANNSGMVIGNDCLLERCSDFLTFGAISKCKKCKGDMIFAKHGYKCNGNIDEWTLCENFEEKPERVKCKIPRELKDRFKKAKTENFFTKFKPKVEDRAVRPQIKAEMKKDLDEDGKRIFKVQREKEPLYGMHVVILGKTETPKDDLKARIVHLGGKLVTKLQEKIAVVISNKNEVEKMNTRMQEVQSLDIQVVPESFLDAIENGKRADAMEKIKSMSICDWGSDPLTRIPQEEEKGVRVS
jgi:NAD-dependent DNA ligase